MVVASPDHSAESTLNGDIAVAEMTLSFTRYYDGQHVTSNVAMSTFGNGSVTFSEGPIGVRVSLNANWMVIANNITGKGNGKGLGNSA